MYTVWLLWSSGPRQTLLGTLLHAIMHEICRYPKNAKLADSLERLHVEEMFAPILIQETRREEAVKARKGRGQRGCPAKDAQNRLSVTV
jgi:hypothetical protein